jgi:uncharacterized protein YkwD
MQHAMPAVALLLALFMGPHASGAVPQSEFALNAFERAVLEAVNTEREAQGLQPVVVDSVLGASGRAWAVELAAEGALLHRTNTQLGAAGHGDWTIVGENLARVSPVGNVNYNVENIMKAFMTSPAHRANVLGPYTALNTEGAFARDGSLYLVLTFIG